MRREITLLENLEKEELIQMILKLETENKELKEKLYEKQKNKKSWKKQKLFQMQTK